MDVILLVLLTWQIGNKAREKKLDVFRWRLRMVLTWLAFEIGGGLLGMMLFGYSPDNIIGLAAFALACAFGGYLLVKAALDKTSDDEKKDDISDFGQ